MTLRPLLFLVLPLSLALGACGAHVERMQVTSPGPGGMPSALGNAVAVGEISGGSSVLNSTGVTDGEFKEALEYALRSVGLLAPDAAAASYRLDAHIRFTPGEDPTFEDQHVDVAVTYRLIKTAGGDVSLEKTIATKYVQAGPSAGEAVATLLVGGIGGLIGDARVHEEYAYEGVVRRNLRDLLFALSKWGSPETTSGVVTAAPTPAAATRAAPTPRAQAATPAETTPPGDANARALNALLSTLELKKDAEAAAAPAPQVAALPPEATHVPVRFGDDVAFRCPAPGTEIDFSDGTRRVFAASTAPGVLDCSFTAAGAARAATAFGAFSSSSAEEALQRLWPLRVGNQVSFVNQANIDRSYDETYRVVRHEMATVPAGTFDTFIIEWDGRGTDQYANGYHETATFWYAPEIGYVVKVEHHLMGGLYARLGDEEAVRVVAR
jgi:hypothetical protein